MYYDITSLENVNKRFNVVIGERRSGKTFALVSKAVKDYYTYGQRYVIFTKYKTLGNRHLKCVVNPLVDNGIISKITNNKYNDVIYGNRCCYLFNNITNEKAISPFIEITSYNECNEYNSLKNYIIDYKMKELDFIDFCKSNRANKVYMLVTCNGVEGNSIFITKIEDIEICVNICDITV